MSGERKLRYTLSAVAWVGLLLCGLGLMSSAISVAAQGGQAGGRAAEVPQR